jgi:hypothetical protein
MVNEDGVVQVLDFGLAKLTEQIQGDETASTATVDGEGRPIREEGVIVAPRLTCRRNRRRARRSMPVRTSSRLGRCCTRW